MSVESRPNKLTKGLVLDTFHTDVDNTVATYALNAQLEDQEGNHFHYGSEVGTTFIKDIPDKHVVIGHINMERNETVLFTTDGTNSTIGVLSRNDDMSYHYEIKVDDSKQTKKLGFKKEGYVRGVYRLLNGCDKVIYFVDGINKDRRININQLDSYKLPDTQSVASGIIFDDSLRATIYALSSATGNIQLIRLLSASPEATANVLANLTSGESLTKLLTASANGIGTAFANLMRTANMISSTNATGTSTANVDIIRLLQSNISSIGSVNAILDVKTQGVVDIDVTLTGVASSTAILLRAALLESNITTEASTLTTAILTRIINAQVQASATTTSTAKITVPVNASANATANTAANAILSYAVNATANAIAQTSATAKLSQVINASLNATATSSVEALIGLVLVSTTTANGSVSTADLYINRLLSSSVTATGTTTAEALIAKLLQSSVTASANTTSNAIVSKLASSSVTASANTTANSLVSKLIASTVNAAGNVTADLKIADLLSTSLSGTASAEALLDITTTLIGDPYIDNVSLLLQGDDNPSGVTQNNTFKDSSTNDFPITRNGNVTQGTFSPFDRALTNSGGSAYFDGVGDYLSITRNSAFLPIANEDFTIEAWVYLTATPGTSHACIVTLGEYGVDIDYGLYINNSQQLYMYFNTTTFLNTIVLSLNTWHHVAVSRFGTASNNLKVFVNGNSTSFSNNTSTVGTGNRQLTIGADQNGDESNFTGYISNVRIVKGTAVYTSNFQPSTIPLTAITNTSLLLNFTNAAIFDGVKLNNIETVGGAQINTSIKQYGTGSLAFDGSGDYLRVNGGSLFDFGTGSFTMECFVYLPTGITQGYLFGTRTGDSGTTIRWCIYISSSTIAIDFWNTSNVRIALFAHQTSLTNNVFHHVAVVRNVNEFAIYLNGVKSTNTVTNSTAVNNIKLIVDLGQSTGGFTNGLPLNGYIDDLRITKGIARYTTDFNTKLPATLSSLIPNYLVSRSLRFNSADSTFLSRTPTVEGNRTTWTWSGWVKRSTISSVSDALFGIGNSNNIRFSNNDSSQKLVVEIYNGVGANYYIISDNLFRDSSAWYHIVVVWNTTSNINSDRQIVYVNNIRLTQFISGNTIPVNTTSVINSITTHNIGRTTNVAYYFNGYMSEVNFIDGQALTPDSFGIRNTSTGVWSPKEYTGTYGTNGFHLNFSDITQLGKDFSGNNNNWTPSGFSVTPGVGYDSLTDVPTPNGTDNGFGGEVRGNYATLNPLENQSLTITNGNLDVSYTTAVWKNIKSTFSMPSGKWYFEFVHTTGTQYTQIGVIKTSIQLPTTYFSQSPFGWSYSAEFGELRNNNNATNSGIFTSAIGDIINVAVDIDAGKIWFGKNGTWFNNGVPSSGINAAYTNLSGEMSVAVGVYNTNNPLVSFNSGQRPFVYKAPTGFKALNTANLPTPAIGGGGESNLANKYMDITTYTGTGAAQSIFNSGFKPDFVWIKSRSAASHILYDINRGVQKRLSTDSTAAEVTDTTGLSSFDNTGFSIGALSQINASGATYVAWQWRAGGTPVTNNSGTITSQVSVSQISGFSVVTYTGNGLANQTVGHGLGVIPSFVIIKDRDTVIEWHIYHKTFEVNQGLLFNTSAAFTASGFFNGMNSSFIGLGYGATGINGNTKKFVAYAWAEIDGFSKFNSYVGNNSTDGTFVYTGFKPKYILIKCSTAAANWVLYNSIVDTGNPVVRELFANLNNAENGTPSDEIDFLSNGFKLRSTNAAINAAQTYIYAAFAETPFKYATAGLTPEVKETVTVDYLVVAGGGGGGQYGGGGGAGGYRTGSLVLNKNTAYSIIIGGGGVISTGNSTVRNGSNSVLNTITSNGGGGGGEASNTNLVGRGADGGSGGGGAHNIFTAGLGNTPSTSPSQGNNGGVATSTTNDGGGGGGSNSTGVAGSGSNGGNGGSASLNSITGIYYAGGGGGWSRNAISGLGGGTSTVNQKGGATDGVTGLSGTASNGSANSGGGGGSAATSGQGGSGVIVIKIPDSITATFSAGVSQSSVTSGGFKTITVTATSNTSQTITFT